jgi:hypothetical protein
MHGPHYPHTPPELDPDYSSMVRAVRAPVLARTRPSRTFSAKSRDLMVRCAMEFDADACMIGCPRTRTSDHAALAPSIAGAHAAAAHLERARNQRVFHFGWWRDTSSAVSIRDGYAARQRAADRIRRESTSYRKRNLRDALAFVTHPLSFSQSSQLAASRHHIATFCTECTGRPTRMNGRLS